MQSQEEIDAEERKKVEQHAKLVRERNVQDLGE
eukprot:COSAG02_NODE_25150_length_667_cov_1.424296_1_plen_32_part_10